MSPISHFTAGILLHKCQKNIPLDFFSCLRYNFYMKTKIILFFILLLTVSFVACANESDAQEPTYQTGPMQMTRADISRNEVKDALENPDAFQILDVRTYEEWSGQSAGDNALGAGRIQGAYHLDWLSIANKTVAEQQAHFAELFDGRIVIIYCHSGRRAGQALRVLAYFDVEILHYTGAWLDWSYAASIAGEDDQQVRNLTEYWTDFGK